MIGNIAKRRKQPRKLDDFVVESPLGKAGYIETAEELLPYDFWKSNVYIPVMDSVIVHFEERFDTVPFARSVDAFLNLNMAESTEFVEHYSSLFNMDSTILNAEAVVLNSIFKAKDLPCDLENLKIQISEEITPRIFKLLQVAIGLPVSAAGCERSFSAMRRIKTWLRTTMTQNRFASLAILNIENEFIKGMVKPEEVLDRFAKNNRKLKLI